MLVEQSKLLLIENNNLGNVYIYKEDIKKYMNYYLNDFFNIEFNISNIQFLELDNFPEVVQVTLNFKESKNIIVKKMDIILESIDTFLRTNIGLRITTVQLRINFNE